MNTLYFYDMQSLLSWVFLVRRGAAWEFGVQAKMASLIDVI